MLPVATPPNAIVFAGSHHLTIPRMARYGFVLNLLGAFIIALVCWIVINPETGILGKGVITRPPAASEPFDWSTLSSPLQP